MLTFPTYTTKSQIDGLEFEISDMSVGFYDRIEKDPSLYNDREILKDATTLTDEQIDNLGIRTKLSIVEAILDLTDPTRHDKKEGKEEAVEPKK